MSIIARLQFGDNGCKRYSKEYLVSDFKCHLTRRHNEARPDGEAKCESMELAVVVPGREDLTLFEWYVNRSSMNGRLLVELSDTGRNFSSDIKQVYFEGAVCYSISEDYQINKNRRRTLRMKFVVDEATIDDVVFRNK
jgi:hypothetical protein